MSSLLIFPIGAFAQEPTSSEKIRRAKDAAIQFQGRFNETLDFRFPYHEMYVPESVSRNEKTGTGRQEIELAKLNDDFEIAMMNLWYLRLAYFLTHDVDRLPREIRAAHGEDVFPFLEDEHETAKAKYARTHTWAGLTRYMQTYIHNANRLGNLYRRYLSPAMFTTDLYSARIKKEEEHNEPTVRVEKSYGYPAFENQDVYKVYYAGIEYWLVEMNGAFKVVHINPLPGFRMSP
ncbi:MAG TPA: hypothetical protein VGC60_06710 [Pyrinomonadaceae bacterium]